MSNGDDVLDNWEEIDEEGLQSSIQKLKTSSASCERIIKTLYQDTNSTTATNTTTTTANSLIATTPSSKTTQMKLLQRPTTQDSTASKTAAKSPLDDMSATFQPVMMVLHKPQDEYQSANYTPPIANQTVKILRRPQTIEPRNNGIRPKQPIKTLQQREQEYAEARLRILGSAKNPNDDQRVSIAASTQVTTPTTNSIPYTSMATTEELTENPLTVSTLKMKSPKIPSGPSQYNNHYNQPLKPQQQLQQYPPSYQQQPQHQHQLNYFYNQQQQQTPHSPAYPIICVSPIRGLGVQPVQYQAPSLTTPQTPHQMQPLPQQQQQHQQQQHLKYHQYQQKSPQQQHKLQQKNPTVGGSVSSPSIRQQQQNDSILRLPRGPDDTTGFQMRR